MWKLLLDVYSKKCCLACVMADKIPWCKFWHSCLSDPDLEELELHQWARWARLVIFLRGHGDNGKMKLEPPARALQNVLRVGSYAELIEVIKLFKNMSLLVTHADALHKPLHETELCYMIVCRNWYKYQEESSKQRVKKWRDKRTVTPYVSRNGVEKSRLDLTSTSTTKAASQGASLTSAPAPQFEEAGENDLCGPPKDLMERFKKGLK